MNMSYSTFVNWAHAIGLRMASEFAREGVPKAQVQMWQHRYVAESKRVALKNGGHYEQRT